MQHVPRLADSSLGSPSPKRSRIQSQASTVAVLDLLIDQVDAPIPPGAVAIAEAVSLQETTLDAEGSHPRNSARRPPGVIEMETEKPRPDESLMTLAEKAGRIVFPILGLSCRTKENVCLCSNFHTFNILFSELILFSLSGLH